MKLVIEITDTRDRKGNIMPFTEINLVTNDPILPGHDIKAQFERLSELAERIQERVEEYFSHINQSESSINPDYLHQLRARQGK